MKTNIYKIFPTEEQERKIINTFGCTRFVYNHYLDIVLDAMTNNEFEGVSQIIDTLPDFVKEYTFLQEVDYDALERELLALIVDMERFFNRSTSQASTLPYRTKKMAHQRYTTPVIENDLEARKIHLPYVGTVSTDKDVTEYLNKHKVNSVTINHHSNSGYYAYFLNV